MKKPSKSPSTGAEPSSPFRQAVTLYSLGRYHEAWSLAGQALGREPRNPDLLHVAAASARALGKLDDAEKLWHRALALSPNRHEFNFQMGTLLQAADRPGEAEPYFRRALAAQPDSAEAHNNLGNLLSASGRQTEAEAHLRKALRIKPHAGEIHSNLAFLLRNLGHFEDSERHFRRAVALNPDSPDFRFSLGNLLEAIQRSTEAEACYREALTLKPAWPEARLRLAAVLLGQGRYEEGWPLYEARLDCSPRLNPCRPPSVPMPRWEGGSLAGHNLLIWHEQGIGDSIQFCRYVKTLKRLGVSRLTVACPTPLKALLQTLDGVDDIWTPEEPVPLPDDGYWTFLLSIPRHLGTTLGTVPANLPYLHPLPDRLAHWMPRLAVQGKRIGLVWKGNPSHADDAHRSLPNLTTLAPLWSVPGISFFSLQKGQGEEEAANPPDGQAIETLGTGIRDFADTAAIIAQLDLVISVDTATAHLAGALGKPCWVMLSFTSTDWRWLHERTDSPWYPGVMRLFRQPSPGDWASVIETVAAELGRWVR